MASPFAVFRKNKKAQKTIFAVLGVVVMITFVFGDCVNQTRTQRAAVEDPVVVTWKNGEIRESQVQDLQFRRNLLKRFLATLMETARQNGAPLQSPQFAPTSEQEAINYLVLTQKADDLGIKVSDQAILDWLKQLTMNAVRPEEYRAIIAGLGGREHRVSEAQLFDLLRETLMASELQQMSLAMRQVDPPAQQWENYRKLERQVAAEVMAVRASDFVDEIPDPDDKTVEAFFEKYKDKYPAPPDPGFRQPYKVTLQYFKYDVPKMAEALAPEVTDEEIAAYYEKNKETQFRAVELPPVDDKPVEKPAETEKSDAKKPSTDEKSAADDKPGEAKAESAKKKSDADKPADSKDEKPKYEPLEKVSDKIRKTLAEEKALKQIEETLPKLRDQLDMYGSRREVWEADRLNDENLPAPPAPDIGKLAQEHNAVAVQTDPLTLPDVQATDLGKSFVEGGMFGMPMPAVIQNLTAYKPRESMDSDKNRFLFWKTSDEQPYVPKLEQVRSDVVRQWKQVQARTKALKTAEEDAEFARKQQKPLGELFDKEKGRPVVQTEKFSLLTKGTALPSMGQPAPRLSQVEGVEEAGAEFLEKVTVLSPGDITVAMNQPQTVAYVVRVNDVNETREQLQSDFMHDMLNYPAYAGAGVDRWSQVAQAWLKFLENEYQLKWVREPRQERGDA